MKEKIAVAVSGGGRSLENLLDQQRNFSYSITGVIASSPSCRAVEIAEAAGLPVLIEHFSPANKRDLSAVVSEWLDEHDIGYVALAGFIKMFPCLPGWERNVVNIHPALLPNFGGPGMYGLHVHQAVLEAESEISGATIHYVNQRYDDGQILAQIQVSVANCRNAQEVADKVFEAERKLYPAALHDLCTGTLPLREGVKVYELKN